MRRSRFRLPVAVLIVAAMPFFARGEEDGLVAFQADPLQAALSPEDGQIRSLAVRGHELLAAPGRLLLGVGDEDPVPVGKQFHGFTARATGGGLVLEGREPRTGVVLRAEWIGGPDLECRVQLASEDQPRVEAFIELRLPCRRQTLQLLAPSGNDHQTVDFSRRTSAIGPGVYTSTGWEYAEGKVGCLIETRLTFSR